MNKLQVKDHDPLLVLNSPEGLGPVWAAWREEGKVLHSSTRAEQFYVFALIFVQSEKDIAASLPLVQRQLEDDGLLWFAYPKKSSKKYRATISRDAGWQALGDLGFEAVRQVAIDADWSALRFRKASQIRSLARDPDRAMSREGKRRTKKK